MRARPADLTDTEIAHGLREAWAITDAEPCYVAVGGGSHHWRVDARAWLTVDDLAEKAFLGATPDAAFARLLQALETARALHAQGLEFVVAPVPTQAGHILLRLNQRYAMARYPLLTGQSYAWGEPLPEPTAAALVDALARMHQTWVSTARTFDVRLAERAELDRTLTDLATPWSAGPYSDALRALLTAHEDLLRHRLRTFDRWVAHIPSDLVVTHGEPHPANVVATPAGLRLVDWDTAALAPVERDLWWFGSVDSPALQRYTRQAGRAVRPELLDLFRLRWPLDDAASFTQRLRTAPTRSADTEHAWRALEITLEILEREV